MINNGQQIPIGFLVHFIAVNAKGMCVQGNAVSNSPVNLANIPALREYIAKEVINKSNPAAEMPAEAVTIANIMVLPQGQPAEPSNIIRPGMLGN